MEAWDGGRRSICFGPSGGFKNKVDLLSARLHFPVASHLNSSRYHLVFFMLTCPSFSGTLLKRYSIMIGVALFYISLGSWEKELSE